MPFSNVVENKGLSGEEVSALCDEGKLLCKKVGGNIYVNEESVDMFKKRREQEETLKEITKDEKDNLNGFIQKQESTPFHHTAGVTQPAFLSDAQKGKSEHIHGYSVPVERRLGAPKGLLTAVIATFFLLVGIFGFSGFENRETYARFDDAEKSGVSWQLAAVGESFADTFSFFRDLFDSIAGTGEYYAIDENLIVGDASQHNPVTGELERQIALYDSSLSGARVLVSGDDENLEFSVEQNASGSNPSTIINQPVIERVIETQRVLSEGGVTPEQLTILLQQMENKFNSQLLALSDQTNRGLTSNFQAIAHTNKIDQLGSVTINSPSITGGTITGATISGGSVEATSFSGTLDISSGGTGLGTAPSYGQLLLGQADGSYTLVATSTLGITSGYWTQDGSDIYYDTGNVGIGTTSPFRKLSVTDTVSTAQAAIAYDATRYTDLLTNAAGDLVIDPSGDDAFLNDDNLWVCTGGSCPSGTPSGTGNLIVENKLGVGTTTPFGILSVENPGSAGPSFVVADASQNTDLIVTADGDVGVGTTTPTEQLSVTNQLFVGAGGASGLGTATSTFQGDIRITGKLDVGTIDPVYSIDGTKYATYGHSSIGVKEEVVFTSVLDTYDESLDVYTYKIDFADLKKGSDLWLFYQITDFGNTWRDMVVSLTPSFSGRAYYKKNIQDNSLTILAEKVGEVSVRLVAPRFDADKWQNLRKDQEDPFTNFELKSK